MRLQVGVAVQRHSTLMFTVVVPLKKLPRVNSVFVWRSVPSTIVHASFDFLAVNSIETKPTTTEQGLGQARLGLAWPGQARPGMALPSLAW